MLSSIRLKDIVSEARPFIERQMDDAERIAGFRDVVADAGGDWSALKALIKAQIKDERDDSGEGKHVQKILDKAEFSAGYADMLGWSNMNEQNFSSDEDCDKDTGEILSEVTTPNTSIPGDDDANSDDLRTTPETEPQVAPQPAQSEPLTREPTDPLWSGAATRKDAGSAAPISQSSDLHDGRLQAVPASALDESRDSAAGVEAPAAPVNPRCLKAQRGEFCKFADKAYSCSGCIQADLQTRARVA